MRAIILLIIGISCTAFAQVPRTISYQGVLTDAQGNLIPDGNHTLTLKLYDAATNGSLLFIETQTVPVVKGVFNAIIGSVTALPASLAFDRAYFLGVSVDGGAELSPRTPLTAAPYALRAERASVAEALIPNAGGVVTRLNGQSGDINLIGGGATTVSQSGNNIQIFSTGGGGGTGIQGVQSTDGSIDIQNPTGPVANISIAANSITSDKIADGSIAGNDIASGVIPNTSNFIANGTPAGGNLSGSYPNPQVANGAITTEKLADAAVTGQKIGSGQVVRSINSLKDDVTLSAGTNVTITPSGNTLTIAASGGGAGYWAANGNDISNANSGKVGIGTSSPATKLDVRGDLTLEVGSSPTIFTSVSNAEENRYLHIINSPNSPSASGLKAGGLLVSDSYGYANPGKNDLIVKGNVGIGTTNPTGKLEVVGGDALKLTGPGPTVTFKDVLNNNLESYIQGLNGDLVFIPNSFHPNSSAMIIKNVSGNVGIGTTNPQAKLDVAGSLKVNGDAIQDRARGGMVKAMVRVNGNGAIRRSFSANGQAISVSRIATGNYIVDFGFNVSDRFIVCQPAMSPGYSNATRISFWVAGDGGGVGPNQVVVLTQSWNLNDQDSAFDIFIF